MNGLILIALAALFAIVALSAVKVLRGDAGENARRVYFVLALLIAAIATWTTFGVNYYVDGNTRVYGWPVPWMVLHRKDAESQWLDYVGPTVILGLPINFLIFMGIPSLWFLVVTARMRRASSARPRSATQ